MKFNAGDRFKVKENGITGQIIGIKSKAVSMSGKDEYTVMWDHMQRGVGYPIEETDKEDIWQLTQPYKVTIQLPTSIDHIPISIEIHRGPCLNHEFVTYVGLTRSYEYCKKCDKKRSL